MIEYATVARPYAKAVFELAQEKEQFDLWLGGLEQLAWLVQQPKVASLIGSVDLNDSEKALQLVKLLDGCEAVRSAEFKNFIKKAVNFFTAFYNHQLLFLSISIILYNFLLHLKLH